MHTTLGHHHHSKHAPREHARHTSTLLWTALLVGALLTLILASPAVADETCYVVADNVFAGGDDEENFEDALLRINLNTGDEEVIGRTETSFVEAIDFHPATGVLYAVDGGRLGTLNLTSGEFTPVSSGPLGSGSGDLGYVEIDDVDGLAFHPTTGVLYGSVRRDGPDLLVAIDHATGSLKRKAFSSGRDYVVVEPVGDLEDIDDIAFDDAGLLYGTANEGGYGDHLVEIDTDTGETDDLGRIRDTDGYDLDNFEAFTANTEGKLIGIRGGTSGKVYEIDPTNARAEKLSTLSVSSDYEAISCTESDPEVVFEKTVDDPAPEKGDEITFTIEIKNSFDLWDVVVVDQLPSGLDLIDTDASEGDVEIYGRTITWTIDHLRSGYREELEITVEVDTKSHVENCAYVDESSPSLGGHVKSCVSVTPTYSSGGGDAGVESDGNLATMMAQRLFSRRQDVQQREALLAAPKPVPFNEPVTLGKTSTLGLTTLVPEVGPQGTRGYTVTPEDLIGVTNATSVLAVDYLRPEGRRMAALFAATSPAGVLYDHTKTTCDRLGGGTLDAVQLIDIGGRPFVLSRLIHADGATDHTVSFVVYRTGDAIQIDSRFAPDDYDVPETVDEVVNLQVWSVAPGYTVELVSDILSRLSDQGSVTYLNTPDNVPPTPNFFVKTGRFEHGTLSLRIATGAEPSTIVVRGSTAATESDAERDVRTDFERTLTLPAAPEGEDAVDVEVELGRVFDAIIEVAHDESGSIDQLYYADGSWSHAAGSQSSVGSFETVAQATSSAARGTYVVERSASMSGSVFDWASLFRFIRPGGQPVDVSAYDVLEFEASGRGMVQVVLEKASIASWDQYSYLISLSPDGRTYQIPFDRFSRSGGGGGFTGEDVTLIAFYVVGNQQFATDFDIAVEGVRFVAAGSVSAEDDDAVPSTARLAGNYPNPFNPSTRIAFELPASSPVRLAVYDVLGREVAVLIDGVLSGGRHEAEFDAGSLSSGTYVYRLRTPSATLTGTMMYLK